MWSKVGTVAPTQILPCSFAESLTLNLLLCHETWRNKLTSARMARSVKSLAEKIMRCKFNLAVIMLAIFMMLLSGCSSDKNKVSEMDTVKTDGDNEQEVDEDAAFVEYRKISDGKNTAIRVIRHTNKKEAEKTDYPPEAQPYQQYLKRETIEMYRFPEYSDKKRFSSHSYGIIDPKTKQAMIIDPGAASVRMIQFWAEQKKVDISIIALTHGHLDHSGGVKMLKRAFPDAVFYAPEKDAGWMTKMSPIQLSGSISQLPPKPDQLLKDGDILSVGQIAFRIIETPGHTVGSICFWQSKEKLLFSGDTLFYKSIGTTRFENSLTKLDLIKSIKTKLKKVSDDTKVYPGHGKSTEMGFERANNPYLQNK